MSLSLVRFTSMLRLIAKQLTDLEVDYAMLTGQTRDRQHQSGRVSTKT